ncbi:lytic murein transglycosylase [Neorhizobium galegae]|uniref:Lytic murein transglycosylase n=1 Tax=Neorhizobium galegae TaxID=399 RepID=A0A6A1TPV0_NEOGA|nr:lytic murein transglycosylase [Neorhizobium galegae]
MWLTPLCPAGHLPLKGRDRVAVRPRPSRTLRLERCSCPQPISPPEGEMPGRAEGG